MSTSDSRTGSDPSAEPVDAEFEPAPEGAGASDSSDKSSAPKAKGGAGWFKVSLFVIAAATIGGASGWLAGQVLHAPIFAGPGAGGGVDGDLEARIAALETASDSASSADLDALQARIANLESAQDASGLRGDAVEQLVRDVADLRGRIDALEAVPTGAPTGALADSNGGEASPSDALSALEARLEARLDEALSAFETQLQTVRDTARTAETAAEQARSAARQAMDAIAEAGAASGAGAGAASGADAAPAPDLAPLRASITELERAQQRIGQRLTELDELASRIQQVEQSAVQPGAVSDLAARIDALQGAVAAAEAEAEAASGQAGAGRDLAARALAFAALRDAASSSEPFTAELSDLARVWPGAPQRAGLVAPARSGAPTLEGLASSFPGDALSAVTGEAQTYFGVLRVRRDGAQGPAAAIESALAADDLAGALQLADGLDGEAAASIASWRDQARARLAIETALDAMARALQTPQESNP